MEWWKIWSFFQVRNQVFLKTIFKAKMWRSFTYYFCQSMLMFSDSRGVSIICILFLDFARFVIQTKVVWANQCLEPKQTAITKFEKKENTEFHF